MKIRNYCIVAFDRIESTIIDIEKVSDKKPNIVSDEYTLMATFCTALETNELTDFFKLNNINFVLFELNRKTYGANINNTAIYDLLFGDIKNNREIKVKNILDIVDVNKLTSFEKTDLLNRLLDSGIENLSSDDKKLLVKLAK